MKDSFIYRLRYFFIVFIPFWVVGLVVVLATPKRELFLEINSFHSLFFDEFFKWETWLGNAWAFIIIILLSFFRNKGWGILGLMIFIPSAIMPQVLKKLVFADVVRPVKYYDGTTQLHLVEGVTQHLYHSFPSGHSTSIVALCLFLSFIINQRKWSILLAVIALLTMYSRVYLAQHFLIDVLAGAILGIIAAWVGIAIYNKWFVSKPHLNTGLLGKKQ